jgi:hypothetical protein
MTATQQETRDRSRFIPALCCLRTNEPPARHEDVIVYNLSIPLHTASRYMEEYG